MAEENFSGSPKEITKRLLAGYFLDKKASYNRDKDVMAIGACIQNMLLEAHELGLATCWLGEILNKRKEVESYLKLGSRYELMAVVALGYPNEKEESKRKSIKSFLT